MGILGLNHAVLYVRDARRSAAFYTDVLGFTVRASLGDRAFFLRAAASVNDHDLGLFEVGPDDDRPRHRVGLYHLAWQVATIEELASVRTRLLEAGALVGESHHGVSASVYARDPDGIEFEVMWAVPEDQWPERVGTWPLDLDTEVARWAGVVTARPVVSG